MAVKYLWDTNTVIYFLQKQFPPSAEKFVIESTKGSKPIISFITEMELLCWKSGSHKDLTILSNFIFDSLVIEMDQSIKLKAVEIRKIHRTKIPDAIIAATALVNNFTIITRNVSDFDVVKGLKIVNAWEH